MVMEVGRQLMYAETCSVYLTYISYCRLQKWPPQSVRLRDPDSHITNLSAPLTTTNLCGISDAVYITE